MIVRPVFLMCLRLAVFLAPLFSAGSHALTLSLAAEDAWPPFSDSQGNGYSRDLAIAAFAHSGVTLNIQAVPYARALNLTLAGKADGCWNVTRQPSTEEQYLFGNEPLFTARASYYFKAGKEKNWHSPADIPDGTQLAVINGYEYGAEFEKHRHRLKLIEVSKQQQMIAMLLNERVEGAIFFDRVFDYTMANSHYDRSLIRRGEENHTSDIYIAFSRANAESEKYARMLDEGLIMLKSSGEYQRIMDASYDR